MGAKPDRLTIEGTQISTKHVHTFYQRWRDNKGIVSLFFKLTNTYVNDF